MPKWRIHGGDVLEGHQFNTIIHTAREAGHQVTFNDDNNTIDINGVSEAEIKTGTQWLEDKTGHQTKTTQ